MDKATILIVDDFAVNREILSALLSGTYNILEAQNGFEALEILNAHIGEISVILLDIMMPELDGFDVLEIVKSNEFLSDIPVILITASVGDDVEQKGFQLGAVDFVSKPFNPHIVRARIDTHAELKKHRDKLKQQVERGEQKLGQLWVTIMNTLASVIEYRSLESGQHIQRTQMLTEIMVDKMNAEHGAGISIIEKDAMVKAAALHDIGKIGIPDNILLKPGRLTAEEFEIMKTHSVIGGEIAGKFAIAGDEENTYVSYCQAVCRHHHEKWDGSGYPDGIAGENIPLAARVISLVDVYDALVSERIYKKAFTKEEALGIITKDSGTHFDPTLVNIFLGMQDEVDEVYKTYSA